MLPQGRLFGNFGRSLRIDPLRFCLY